MRKFRFIGSQKDIDAYTPPMRDHLEINKVYSEQEIAVLRGNWDNPEVNLVPTDWQEVTENSIEEQTVTLQGDLQINDLVNAPIHYNKGKIECIDAIEAAVVGKGGFEGALVANVIKYLWRYEEKGGVTDIKKAQFYLNKLLDFKQ